MHNFVDTLLSFFLLFSRISNISLILILYKLDNSYICLLGKSVMSRHELSTMFATPC